MNSLEKPFKRIIFFYNGLFIPMRHKSIKKCLWKKSNINITCNVILGSGFNQSINQSINHWFSKKWKQKVIQYKKGEISKPQTTYVQKK